ncbi:hypothetical protein MXB_5148, partial [Myxobolus squamalis]
VEEFDQLCCQEQELTSSCIKENPKAYCVWNHRLFVLKQKPIPDFQTERYMIDIFFESDPRNCNIWLNKHKFTVGII